MSLRACLAVLATCLAGALWADPLPVASDPDPYPGEISPGEWQSMSRGKTLMYRIEGTPWALERYPSGGGNQVMLQFIESGECISGNWTFDAGIYCFNWNSGEQACFRHIRAGEEVLVIHVEDGQPTGGVQTMDVIGDMPLQCSNALTS